MQNPTESSLKNKRRLHSLFVLILGIIMIWTGMGNKTASAGENIWTWAGVSGYVE
jgi:hypothetical protein